MVELNVKLFNVMISAKIIVIAFVATVHLGQLSRDFSHLLFFQCLKCSYIMILHQLSGTYSIVLILCKKTLVSLIWDEIFSQSFESESQITLIFWICDSWLNS